MTRPRLGYAEVLRGLEARAAPGSVPYTFDVDADDRELRDLAWATCPICGVPRLRIENVRAAARLTCFEGCPSAEVGVALTSRYEEDRAQPSDASIADNPRPRPDPCNGTSGGPERDGPAGQEPELRTLIALYEQGRLRPKPVRLGPLPDDASSAMRGIARDMALRIGLRLAVDEDRPLPYATSEAVRGGLCLNRMQASRAIRKLVVAGVIDDAGSLPRRGGRHGTKLYAPPAHREDARRDQTEPDAVRTPRDRS